MQPHPHIVPISNGRHYGKEAFFQPLEYEFRPTVTTEAAAYYLNRKPQTLHIWACKENGPIRPLRIGRNLAWPTAELKRLLGLA
jgi:hypothetical protein